MFDLFDSEGVYSKEHAVGEIGSQQIGLRLS